MFKNKLALTLLATLLFFSNTSFAIESDQGGTLPPFRGNAWGDPSSAQSNPSPHERRHSYAGQGGNGGDTAYAAAHVDPIGAVYAAQITADGVQAAAPVMQGMAEESAHLAAEGASASIDAAGQMAGTVANGASTLGEGAANIAGNVPPLSMTPPSPGTMNPVSMAPEEAGECAQCRQDCTQCSRGCSECAASICQCLGAICECLGECLQLCAVCKC